MARIELNFCFGIHSLQVKKWKTRLNRQVDNSEKGYEQTHFSASSLTSVSYIMASCKPHLYDIYNHPEVKERKRSIQFHGIYDEMTSGHHFVSGVAWFLNSHWDSNPTPKEPIAAKYTELHHHTHWRIQLHWSVYNPDLENMFNALKNSKFSPIINTLNFKKLTLKKKWF